MANSKYVPNRNVIQDKRKKKEEEEKKTGYRYDSKGRKITSSNTNSGEKKTTSSSKSGEVKKTSPSSANRTSGTQMRISRAEAAKAGMNSSKPNTQTAAPYSPTYNNARDRALDQLYLKYGPTNQQIMQGVGNSPNKALGTRAYHESTWKGATGFSYEQMANSNDPAIRAQYKNYEDLIRAAGGATNVLDSKQQEIDKLKEEGKSSDWWLGWTGLKKQTNKKKINEAEDQYQDYKNALRKFGFDSVSTALNSEDPNAAAAKGIIDKQYKYTSDNMADDLVTIDEALRYGTNKGSEFDAAVERLNAYYGEDVLPRIEEIHDPAGMWMNEFLDRYDADRAELDTFVKDSSGVSGTDAEITADDMFAYREAVDNQVENETKLAEWNVSRDAMHESFRADPEYDTFAQYIPRGEWYTSAVDSDNGIEKWDDASMLNDLVNAVHTGEYDKVAEEIMGTQHSDTAAALIDYIRYMSPDDVSDFNYILNTSGYDEAFKFITEDIMWNLGRQYEDEKATRIQQEIAENPWMAVPYSITSFGDMLASGIGGVAAAINPLTGQELNEYHPLLSWSRGMNTKRGATTGMLMNEFEDASIAGFHVPSILYNGAMSAADSAINTAIYGHMATPMMAFSAYGSSLYQNLESMGNGAGAYIDAAIDGGIEALTEYFSVEGLLDDAVSSGLKTFSKQLITEPSEEVFGELLRFGYDTARNGENSEVNRQINDLIAQGYSESEAEAIAARDFARKLGETIFTSAISGAAGGARNAIQQGTANYQAGKQFREFGDAEDYTGLIDIAKTVDLNKNEKKLLERLEAEIAAGNAQDVTAEEQVPEATAEQEATEQQEAPEPEINPAERLNDMKPQEREKKEAPPLPVFNRHKEATDTGTGGKETETAPEVTAPEETTEQEAPEAVEEQAEDIAEEVKENPKTNAAKAADKMNKAAKAKGAKKVTKAQLGMLYRSVAAKLDERAQDALRERMSFNVAKELQQKGVKGEKAKELATSILRIQDGNFTQEDFEAVQNDSVARSVLADWTQKLDAENKAQAQMAQIRSIMPRGPVKMTGGAKDGEKDAIEANDEFAVKAAEVEEKAKGKLISDDEDSTIDGEAVKIVGAAPPTTADGGDVAMVKVQAEDGTERIVAADSIAYSEADSTAYDLAQYATSYGANADIMYGAYQAGQDVGAYAAAFDLAARHGSDGRNINTLLGGSVANVLTENQIKTAYELGRGMRAQRSQKAQAARSKKGAGAKVGNVDTSAIADAQLNKHQKATVKAMESVAELLGINVRFVESKADAKGRFTTENGSWDANTRTLTVDIHAGSNLKNDVHYSMMDTVGHELTHYIRQLADSKMWNDYQDFVMSHLGEKMNLGKEIEKKLAQNEGLSRDDAIEEIIADASAQALSRITDQQIAEMAQSNPNLLKKIAAFIKKWVSDFRKQIRKAFSTQEAAANRFAKAMEDSLDEMAAKWNAMLVNAQKNAQGTKADTTVEAAMAEATEGAVNEDGEKLFSLRTMREDKDYYRELLIEYGSMNHADIRALFNTIDKLMAEIEANRTILDFGEDIDSDKRSFKPVKPNSDPLYQVSVDFSTLCRKRLLQQVCQERLEAAMGRAVTKAERVAIRDELIKLQKQGKQIEVACALCYVESARLKSPAQIQRFMENREKVIRDYFARRNPETKAKMEKAEADYRKANNIGNESLKNLPSAIATKVRNAKNAPIAEYKVSAQEQKTIDKALGMTVSEFTTADSLWNLKSSDPVLFDIYTSYIRNATKSKGIESDTPWKAGDSEAISDTLIEKMNQENGLRTQSWSDFQTYHILDYIASVIELSTRNAKMQAYTKVPAYVKLMGKTGIMINMSLIPAAKFDGTLQYDDVEGFVHEMAFELRKKYPETAGTICIGIDDAQIRMLLENDEIDYVIPYHKSGMDAKTRQKMQIPTWKDYELQQSEKPLNKKAGKAPKFSEWFDYKTAVRDAEYANSTAEGKAAIAAGDVMYGAKIAMQNAAQHYLNMCAERNLAPKFEKFKDEDGYWKLLIDRKMINNETGAIIEQKAVQPRFNEDDLIEICRDEVARFNQNNADFDAAVDAILNAYEDGTLGKTAKSKKVQQIVKSHEDWVAVQAAIGTHDQLVPDVKLSAREADVAEDDDIRYQMRDPSEVSDREMLVSMLDNVNLSVEDRNRLNVYRERIGELNEKQQLLEQTITKIRMLRKADEKGNREEIIKLKNQQEIYAKQIERADAKLLEIEALGPIREMAKRQRAAYVKKTRAKNTEKMQEYRNRKKEETAERIDKIRIKEAIKRNELRNEIGRLKQVAEPNLKERYRNKILSDVKKLYSWVATPTNKAHVPEFLKAPLGEFIQSIDYSAINVLEDVRKVREKTKREISMAEALENLRRVLANAHNQKNIEEGAVQQYGYMDLPAQYLEQMDELVGDIKEALKNAATVTDTPLMLLNSDQLKYLSEKITVLKHSVEKMNENFNKNQFESPRSAADATIGDMYKLKAKIKTNQMLETLNGMYNWKNATPIYAFQRMGAGGKAVFAGMQDGWDKMAQNSATLIEFAENAFTAKQAKEWSRDIKTIELANGESVKLTAAQIMSVYCLNKREQAVGHLLGGGMRVAEIKLGKGNVLNQAENHTLTEGDIEKMISLLTTEQISVATELQTFMNTVCSDWGNEISMKRFGYKMFTEQFYFPIEVDPNNLIGGEDKQEKKNSMFRLLNMSAMKPLTPKANNALIVRDIFDVFTAHSTDIAKYNALALPILDMIRWYNYVEKSDVLDEDGKFTGQIRTRSTQRALEHAYGSNAKQYIRRFMEDLNAEHDGGRNDGVLQKLMGNAKAASVGANARVYFLQITSLPRAAYVINPKYLMKGLMKLRSLNPVNAIKGTEAQDKIGIMKWKSLGFYNTDIARSTRGMVRRDEGFLSKLRGWVMKPAEWGDNWVGNIIYEAAKAEMKDKHPGAKPGTKAYDELLNRRVREIVYKTQVVDSTMTRSDFMRSKGIMQLFTAFMSEPTLTVNMLNESVQEAVANRRSGMTGKENWKSVGGKVARALATFAVSACSAALIEALFDAFRDDDEYETFWEKYLDGLFGERMKDSDTFGKKFWAFLDGNIAENMNVISMLPLFKDALSKLQGFEENSMVMQVVDQFMDTWKAIDAWQKGERPLYNAIYNMLKVVGSSSGVGVQNATRDGIAIWNTFFADAVGQPKVQTYENTKSDAAAAYYDAIRNDDTEKAEWILERAAIRGFNEEDFIGKIKDYVKADYVQGDIDAAEATKYLTEIAGKTKDDAYWMLKEWDYAGEGNFSKYGDLRTALIDGNKSNAQAAYNELAKHGTNEVDIRKDIAKLYNDGTATNMLNLQLRSNNLYTSEVKLKADGEIHKDDFDAFITAIVNGSGIEREADKLFEKGYTVKQCMGAINGAFGNENDIYRKMEMYNSREAAILMDRILDGYEAIGLDRQDEIEWIEDNWKM